MQSVMSFFTFTAVVEENYQETGGYILHQQIKMQKGGSIPYQFYKKPMANKFCVMVEAALPEETKIVVLAQ